MTKAVCKPFHSKFKAATINISILPTQIYHLALQVPAAPLSFQRLSAHWCGFYGPQLFCFDFLTALISIVSRGSRQLFSPKKAPLCGP